MLGGHLIRNKILTGLLAVFFVLSTSLSPIAYAEGTSDTNQQAIDALVEASQTSSTTLSNIEGEQNAIQTGQSSELTNIEDQQTNTSEIKDLPIQLVANATRAPKTFNFNDLVANGSFTSPKVDYFVTSAYTAPLDGIEVDKKYGGKGLKVSVNIADSFEIVAGDTVTFPLPADLQYNYGVNPNGTPLYDEGVEFGQLFLTNNVLKIVFNDHFETLQNRNFWFRMEARIVISDAEVTAGQKTFTLFGKTYTISTKDVPGTPPVYDRGHNKRNLGTPRTNGHGRIGWELRINYDASMKLDNLVITDTLGPGQTLVEDLSVIINPSNYIWETNMYGEGSNKTFMMQTWTPGANYEWNNPSGSHRNFCVIDSVVVAPDKKSFTITMSKVTSQCYIYYEVQVAIDALDFNYTNKAVITESGKTTADLNNTAKAFNAGGGSGNTIKYNVNVTKKDGDTGANLAGAVVKLVRSDGLELPTKTTSSTGVATFTNVPSGTYSIVEVTAPSGYAIAAPKTIVLAASNPTSTSVQADFLNYKSGTIRLQKVEKDNTTPINAETIFKVTQYAVDGTTVVKTSNAITNASGLLTLTNLDRGVYEIEEVLPPEGYARSTEVKRFVIGPQPVTNTVVVEHSAVFVNEKRFGEIHLVKVDDAASPLKPLEGAEFTVTGPNNYNETITTDAAGKVSLTNLAAGTYTFTETKAPAHYEITSAPFDIIIGYNAANPDLVANLPGTVAYEHEIEVSNREKPKTSLKLVKVDADTNNPLEGVVFDIYAKDATTGEFTVVEKSNVSTDANGEIVWLGYLGEDGPAYGQYMFKETKPLAGYKAAAAVYFEITANKREDVQSISNEKLGSFSLTKVNENNPAQKLANVGFKLEFNDGNGYVLVSDTLLTDSTGALALNDLARGQYRLTETKAANGFFINTTPIEFTVGYNATKAVNYALQNGDATLGHEFILTNKPFPPYIPTPPIDPDNEVEYEEIPEELVEKIEDLKDVVEGFPEQPPTFIEKEKAEELYKDYENLNDPQQNTFELLIDVDKLKQVAEYNGPFAPERLPQTNAMQSTLPLGVGISLLGIACWLSLRRRQIIQ